jgi:hypothetical protein
MAAFCIIETEDGMSIVEHRDDLTAEEAARQSGGVVLDSGPYPTYEEACEALVALQQELDDDETSDVPGTQALEGRSETPD